MENDLKISERLTELMSEKEISNSELANFLGVTACSVARWKRGAKNMRFAQFIKIADYFNCSLDYLVGRSDKFIDFIPKECPPFYEHLKHILANKKITKYRINTQTKIKSSHFVDWKNGANPQIYSLIELADYLDISIDILVGRDR